MSKIKLRIQLNQDFEVDLKDFSVEGMNEDQIKRELIKFYLLSSHDNDYLCRK